MKIGFLMMLMAGCFYIHAQECNLKKESDDIRVYTCKTQGERLKSLKAEATLHGTAIVDFANFLREVKNYPQWQYNMALAEILKQETSDSFIVHSEIDAPWPLEDRELIVRYIFTHDPAAETLRIVTETIPYDFPKKKGIIRVPFSYAQWDVKQIGNDLKVTYFMRIDPGGSVPAWLVNLAMAEGPYSSFVNLKKKLEK